MMTPYVTMLTNNKRPELLKRALRTLFSQSLQDFKLIFCENGGEPITDPETLHLIEDGRVESFVIDAAPIPRARNAMAALVPDDAAMITLDDDDVFAAKCLEVLCERMDEGFDVVYGDCLHDDGTKRTLRWSCGVPYSKENMLKCCCIFHPALFTKDVFMRAGRYSEVFTLCSAYDMFLRVSELPDVRVSHVMKPLYYYNCKPGHVSTRTNSEAKQHFINLARTHARERRGL